MIGVIPLQPFIDDMRKVAALLDPFVLAIELALAGPDLENRWARKYLEALLLHARRLRQLTMTRDSDYDPVNHHDRAVCKWCDGGCDSEWVEFAVRPQSTR